MRIVCQSCSAAYAIDDTLITARGVRAQCPRCRHLQLVKRAEPAGGAAPARTGGPSPPPLPAPPVSSPSGLRGGAAVPVPTPAPTPFLFDLGPSAGAPAPRGPSARAPAGAPLPPSPVPSPAPFAFDFSAPVDPPGAGSPFASEQAASSPGARGAFDFASLSPAPGDVPWGEAPPGIAPEDIPPPVRDELDFTAIDLTAPPGDELPPPPSSRSGAGLGAPRASTTAVGACRGCGTPLIDPFDVAVGICDACRARAVAGPTHDVALPASRPSPRPEPKPKLAPPRRDSAVTPGAVHAEGAANVRSAQRERGGWGPAKTVALIAGLALVAGGGVYMAIKRPWARRAPLLVAKHEVSVRPVEGIIQQWRLEYPNLGADGSRSARELTELGELLLLRDTTSAYREADEAFRKALVLDPTSDRAMAGWALGLAFGRGGAIDEATGRAADSMLSMAEQRGGEPRIFVAHAHLLLARGGNPNDVRVLAERGKSSPSPTDRALAALALAQTLLSKNPRLASTAVQEALALDPQLKRAYFTQSQLAASLGNYRGAVESLERRLALDRDQWEAVEVLAQLYVEVGELAKARRLLEAARDASPTAARPRLALAMLGYQHLGELPRAEAELLALASSADFSASERAEAWSHLGAVRRLAGQWAGAAEALDRALELKPDLLAARVQKLLVLIERGVHSSARLEFDAWRGSLDDAALAGLLEGRLLFAEGRFDEAVKVLEPVAELDGRRIEALLLGGAAAARAHQDGKAWELCLKRALRAEPKGLVLAPLAALSLRPADWLRGAAGAYERLAHTSDDDPNPALCEGLMAYAADDLAAADRSFARVVAIDPRNAEAYALRALIAMQRREWPAAARFAARGVDANKASALAQVALGLSALHAEKPEDAKLAAAAALRANPALLLARTLAGEVAARTQDPEEARRLLTGVLLVDPLYREAKRVLYKEQL